MLKKIFASLLLSFGLVSLAFSNPRAQNDTYEECVSQLLELGARSNVMGGHSEVQGDFVVASYRMKNPTEFDNAAHQSRRGIGVFLGVKVESLAESTRSREKTFENGKAEEVFTSSFKSITRSSVDMVLAGISLKEVREKEGKIFAIYTVSEKDVASVKEVSSVARQKKEGLWKVTAIGMASIHSDNSPSKIAMEEARKEAIKMVSGMVLVASSSLRNDQKGVHQSVFGQTQGVIQDENVLSEGEVGDWYKVTCEFTIDVTGLFKEYSAHFIALGSPKFYIDYTERPNFKSDIVETLSALNIPIVANKANADYALKITEKVAQRTHPLKKYPVSVMSIVASLEDCHNKEVYWSSEVYEAAKGSEFHGSEYREKECLRIIFNDSTFPKDIHEEINNLVQRILHEGREIVIKFDIKPNDDINFQVIFDTIKVMPGVISAEMQEESIVSVRYPGRATILDELLRSELSLTSFTTGYSVNLNSLNYAMIRYTINTQ